MKKLLLLLMLATPALAEEIDPNLAFNELQVAVRLLQQQRDAATSQAANMQLLLGLEKQKSADLAAYWKGYLEGLKGGGS